MIYVKDRHYWHAYIIQILRKSVYVWMCHTYHFPVYTLSTYIVHVVPQIPWDFPGPEELLAALSLYLQTKESSRNLQCSTYILGYTVNAIQMHSLSRKWPKNIDEDIIQKLTYNYGTNVCVLIANCRITHFSLMTESRVKIKLNVNELINKLLYCCYTSPAPLSSIPADWVDRQPCVSPSCPVELCDSDCMGTRPSIT